MPRQMDQLTLQAALIGYQKQLEIINARMQELNRELAGQAPQLPGVVVMSPQRKHHVSPEGRARIAAAQRKRWAALKRAQHAA